MDPLGVSSQLTAAVLETEEKLMREHGLERYEIRQVNRDHGPIAASP